MKNPQTLFDKIRESNVTARRLPRLRDRGSGIPSVFASFLTWTRKRAWLLARDHNRGVMTIGGNS